MAYQVVCALVALACAAATVMWGRSSRRLERIWQRTTVDLAEAGPASDVANLARSAYRKEIHTAILYAAAALVAAVLAVSKPGAWGLIVLVMIPPLVVTFRYGPRFLSEARVAEQRVHLERRAEEVLAQEELAPQRWAARLAPAELPQFEGFEVGRVYEAGAGVMAGDFYDLFPTSSHRLAAVIGDVSGHGIEASITAFQVKYLLRVFLRQYRDPAQALEELNKVMSAQGRPEEFVSLVAAVFDTQSGTVRYASAGHPPAWMWSDGEVRALRATGPLLTIDPRGTYGSRELALEPGDLLLLYTDGLAEARSGEHLFGEERIAAVLRRDPGQDAKVLTKNLLEAAQDFASEPISDDIAILAVRRI